MANRFSFGTPEKSRFGACHVPFPMNPSVYGLGSRYVPGNIGIKTFCGHFPIRIGSSVGSDLNN